MDFDIFIFAQKFSMIEIIAVISALLFTILAAYENILCWPFGIFSSFIYLAVCMNVKLYQDAFIHVFYVVMGIYGWWIWAKKKSRNNNAISISILSTSKRLIWLLIGVLFTALSGYFFYQFTDASLPFLDAFTTVFALLATWLQARKIIDNWIIFIAVDLVAVFIYYYKELYLTSFLFAIYTLLAAFAFVVWNQKRKAFA